MRTLPLRRLRQGLFRRNPGGPASAVFGAPPVDGLGSTGGFKMQVQDTGGGRAGGLARRRGQRRSRRAGRQPGLIGLFSSFSANQPQLYRRRGPSQGQGPGRGPRRCVSTRSRSTSARPTSTTSRSSTATGRSTSRPTRSYRLRPEDVGKLKVRNASGEMVPLSTMITVKDVTGPAIVNHYNLYPSAEINGSTRAGHQLRPGDQPDGRIARQAELPAGMSYEWTELTYQQIEAGKDLLTKLVFPLAVLFVFLVLAAQYESWSLPLAIILIVPMCLLAAITGVWLTRPGQQHLHADRPGGAGRPGGQERHPDRRVRQAAARTKACTRIRGGGGGLPGAPAADPDDLVRVHPRRGAAGAGQGGRGRDAAWPWASPCSAACWA